jgi:dTDP-4-amino-4,6-dideoxygalactose transaminase
MTTGEGGAILTNNEEFTERLKMFRSHGINNDYKSRHLHYYSMTDIGFNYRLTDIQAALGTSQLKKLKNWVNIRNDIAKKYDNKLKEFNEYLEPLTKIRESGYHIYIIKLKQFDRDTVYKMLRDENIGVNVHYKPIHLQPFYLENYNTFEGQCPISEKIYKNIITLPIFPTMNDQDIDDVVNAIKLVVYKLK